MQVQHNILLTCYNAVVDADSRVSDGCCSRVVRLLKERGVSSGSWPLYLIYGDGLLQALGSPFIDTTRPDETIQNTITFLNLIHTLDMNKTMLPPQALVESIKHWNLPNNNLEVIPHRFFYALCIACTASEYVAPKRHQTMDRFIERKLLPIIRWYFSTGQHLIPNESAAGALAPWLFLEEDYRKWRSRERLDAEQKSPAPADWPPFIESFELGNFRFVALASHLALELESKEMSHCIRTYARKCFKGMLRAYSIRNTRTGERIATCTVLETVPGHWNLEDLRGDRNQEVDADVRHAAIALLRAYERYYQTQADGRRLIDEWRARSGVW